MRRTANGRRTCRAGLRHLHPAVCLLALLIATTAAGADAPSPPEMQDAPSIVIASKTFTESYVLAELFAQTLEGAGFAVERRPGLGGTLICFSALRSGEIDLYPEYTGTLHQAALKLEPGAPPELVARRMQALGLRTSASLGFNNTYAIVMDAARADALGITRISDLRRHRSLQLGFTHEFLERPDGWPGLAERYGLRGEVRGLEHALAYQAIADGKLDVTDAYATDGDLDRYGLRVLEDDLAFFPEYLAIALARDDLPAGAMQALEQLAGRLDDATMRELNARAVVSRQGFASIASAFLDGQGIASGASVGNTGANADDMWSRLGRNVVRHLQLTFAALLLACIGGIALGVAVHQRERLSRVVVYGAGLLQTVPSIALFALMIPLFGIGWLPAMVALFLYSLLPILRSTIAALRSIDPTLRRVAEGIGLTRGEQVRHVLMPLALPNVLAGLRTSAVICVGTATLAAFIGAGGLGEPIFTGLTLNNTGLILQGAIPAALLALATELGFELLEARLIPAHMRSGGMGSN